jgi:hypothetical protein
MAATVSKSLLCFQEDQNFLIVKMSNLFARQEEKATYHGRRSEPTMFTDRQVKVRDLVGIANFHLTKRGKPTLKSSTTVLNRSRPRNKRSIQGRKHIGWYEYLH